jgi:uncharacterized protein DUF2568
VGRGPGQIRLAAGSDSPPLARRVAHAGEVQALRGVSLAIRFALELSALAALAYWGTQTGSGVVLDGEAGGGATVSR